MFLSDRNGIGLGIGNRVALAQSRLLPWQFPEVLDYWDARYGISQGTATERVSAWAPTLEGADSLAQATAGNQPILLPYAGVNYLWIGAAANYASTPSASQNAITGNIDIRIVVALNDWTPATTQRLCAKSQTGAGDLSWVVWVLTDGKLRLQTSADGTNTQTLSVSTVATGFTDFSKHGVRVTRNSTTGEVLFYTSEDDGETWTQLGGAGTDATTGAMFDSACVVSIGTGRSGLSEDFLGKIYKFWLYSGINGALAIYANFTAVSEGSTTFTESSANAATVTINSTGAKPAQIVGSQQVLFDGTAYTLSTGAITLNQPISVVLVGKQITWTGNDLILDGNTANTLGLKQTTSTPRVSINAGAAVAENAGWTLGANAVVGLILNGASSQLQINLGTATTGDAGAGNPSGLFLGSNATPAAFGNFQIKALTVANSALSQSRLNQLIRSMGLQFGIAL